MAGVLCLLIVGLGASVQKKKSSPGDEPWGAKEYEAACACRSPVTQKSRSQARLFLPAKPFCENLASLLLKAILVKVTKNQIRSLECAVLPRLHRAKAAGMNATVSQLWCELCVVLFHYSTRDCYSIGYREKEIERDLEVGFYVFEF